MPEQPASRVFRLWHVHQNVPGMFWDAAKVILHNLQEVSVGHNAVFNPRFLAGDYQVIADVLFRWCEHRDFLPDTYLKRMCIDFRKLNPYLFERLADLLRVELKIG